MGQIVSALVCLYCRSGCKSSVVASALTFHPPDPFYSLQDESKGAKAVPAGKEGGGAGTGGSADKSKVAATVNSSIAGMEYRPCITTFHADLQYLSDTVKGQHQAFFVTTSNGTQVPIMVWGAKPKTKTASATNSRASSASSGNPTTSAQFTIIVSHGNAADLGSMYVFYSMMYSNLGVNVVGYDYTGYGASAALGPPPTEQQT
jgi:hypothetical protein